MRIRQRLPAGRWIFALSVAFSVLLNYTLLTRISLSDVYVLPASDFFHEVYTTLVAPSDGLGPPSTNTASLAKLLAIASAETPDFPKTWSHPSLTWKSKLSKILSTSKPSVPEHIVILAPSDGPYFLSPLAYFLALETLQRNEDLSVRTSVTILGNADTLHASWSNNDTAYDARLAVGSIQPDEYAEVYAKYVRSGQLLVRAESRSSGSFQRALQSLLQGSAAHKPVDGFIDLGGSMPCSGSIAEALEQRRGILSEISTAFQARSDQERKAVQNTSSRTLPWLVTLDARASEGGSSELKALVRSLSGDGDYLHAVQLYIPERPMHTLYGQGSCTASYLSASILASPKEWRACTNSSTVRDIRQPRVRQREAMRQTARSSPLLLHFALSALGDLPIHFDYDSDLDLGSSLPLSEPVNQGSTIDLLHTSDLAEAIGRTILLLQEARSHTTHRRAVPSFFAAIDVLSGVSTDIQSIAADIIAMTQSRSPVGWLITREGRSNRTSGADAASRSDRVHQLKAVLGVDLQTRWQDTLRADLAQLLVAQGDWMREILHTGKSNGTGSLIEPENETTAYQYSLGTGWDDRGRFHCDSSMQGIGAGGPSIAQLEAGLAKLFGFSRAPNLLHTSPPTEMQLITPGDSEFFSAIACTMSNDHSSLQPGAAVQVIKDRAMTYHGGPPMVIARLRQTPTQSSHNSRSPLQMQLSCAIDKEGHPSKTETFIGAGGRSEVNGSHLLYASISSEQSDSLSWLSVHFVDRTSRAFVLTYEEAGASARKVLVSNAAGLVLVPEAGEGIVSEDWRVGAGVLLLRPNPICGLPGPSEGTEPGREDAWDFWRDDPMIVSNIYYPSAHTRNNLRNATLEQQRCLEVQSAHGSLLNRQASLIVADTAEEILASGLSRPQQARLTYDGRFSQWTPASLPICKVDCAAPIPCLATEECRCVRYSCGDSRMLRDTLASYNTSLEERVAEIPWSSVVLPGARRAFSLRTSVQPLKHVFDLPTSVDRHADYIDCTDIHQSYLPQIGDHYLVTEERKGLLGKSSFSTLSDSTADSRDWFILPFYQKCYAEHAWHPQGMSGALSLAYETAANQVQSMTSTLSLTGGQSLANASTDDKRHLILDKMLVPFVHDWGSCAHWTPLLEDMSQVTKPHPMLEAISWQPNGDLYSPCLKPDRDIIVPGTSKNMPTFLKAFRTVEDVRPSSHRRYLGFFSGGARAYGATARTRLACKTAGISAYAHTGPSKSGDMLINRYKPNSDYQATLNDTKFCLLPRGLPAWTTRTFEAIYSGCIPAFVAERNLWPWSDILDYSTFSLSIPETRLNEVEEILQSYDDAAIARMQAALLKVRDLFAFREAGEGGWETDDGSDGERGRRGPIWMTAASMALRLGLTYPLSTEETATSLR